MVNIYKNIKKANSQILWGIGVLAVAGLGYNAGWFSNVEVPSMSTAPGDVSSLTMPTMYAGLSATNTTLFTVTSTGIGADADIMIEVDADTLGDAARTETFTLSMTQDMEGQAFDSNQRYSQRISTGFTSNINMQDTSDVTHIFMDYDASTIDSSKGYKIFDFTGSTPVEKTLSLKFNTNGVALGTLTAINDVGEYKIYDLDFGQTNKVQLKIKE